MTSQLQTGNLIRYQAAAIVLLILAGLSLFVDAYITSLRSEDLISGDLRRIIRLSEIFAHGFGIAVVLYLLWLLAPDQRRLIPRIAACAIVPGFAAQLVKAFIERRRPGYYWPEFTDNVSETWLGVASQSNLNFEYITQSFPSAHAATAVGLALGLAWRFPRGRTAFCGLALLGASQRVFAGAHWTSDVFAGAAIGVSVCGFLLYGRRMNSLFSRIETGRGPENNQSIPRSKQVERPSAKAA